ncbi:uncharacterized protein B0I36DRAFT_105921 [Microdochium trichocladiopsis]|uniref:MARVEL domain-containing protein n=1 Tax=Microdochium trichocladiopsis TaxID=1682393 RepID=A0A9P8YBQ9_9PEZI|nr:uncharacterized protein B0I36DRAFT_105921 [Microdochium trichocladiopsis]KAH7033188.1 hypothetical protein B0I36DRAFT_105921 [Microdochium trichocladiopsis]
MGFADKFDINPDSVPTYKLALHSAQIVLAVVVFILEIVLFRAQDAIINGHNGWVFGLCFLSIPAWVYLAGAPRYERTRRIAQPAAMTVVDCIWAIFWLSAFASQAAYNSANSCGQGCAVSRAIVGMCFFELLLWILSTLVSFFTLKYWHANGDLPGYERLDRSNTNIDPDKAAFSMAPHDEEAYAPISGNDHDDDHHSNVPYNADAYGSVNSNTLFDSSTSYGGGGAASTHTDPFADTSYGGGGAHSTYSDNSYGGTNPYSGGHQASGSQIYAPPTAEEDYDDGRPAKFPAANYDRTLH